MNEDMELNETPKRKEKRLQIEAKEEEKKRNVMP